MAVAGALTLFPMGNLFAARCVVSFFVLFDMLDGAMARERGGGTRFGAVLDATCDRLSDGAVFCGLLWWIAFGMHDKLLAVATLICLVTSQVISYIKARAEASGLRGDGGIIERPERLIIVLARCRRVGLPVRRLAARVAGGDVAAGGGQRGHLRAAAAHGAEVSGRDGAHAVIATPAGLKLVEVPRRLIGGVASDWAYAAGWMAVRAMPEFAARNAFGAGARYAARHGGPEQLRKNLARVIGVRPAEVPDALMRASLASYARYWREAFRLPTMDHRALARRLDDSL